MDFPPPGQFAQVIPMRSNLDLVEQLNLRIYNALNLWNDPRVTSLDFPAPGITREDLALVLSDLACSGWQCELYKLETDLFSRWFRSYSGLPQPYGIRVTRPAAL